MPDKSNQTNKILSHKLFLNRELNISHLAYNRELSFYDAVKAGDIAKVKELMLPLKNENLGTLSDNMLRNLKYHLTITVALITRFCMEGGMPAETAYTLSDIYIQRMDKLNSEEEIAKLHETLVFDFTKRMKKLSRENIFSKQISICIGYIEDHLHEKISLDSLAKHLDLNKTYLCKLFKKEVGITIGDYIKKLKIEAASNMLVYSDYSPSDISNYFSFSSHSHFINVFKAETGLTPNQYRNVNYGKHFS